MLVLMKISLETDDKTPALGQYYQDFAAFDEGRLVSWDDVQEGLGKAHCKEFFYYFVDYAYTRDR